MRTFYKFMGRYPELASKFNKSPSSMIRDSVLMVQLYHSFPQLMKKSQVPDVVHKTGYAYSSKHLMPSLINIS